MQPTRRLLHQPPGPVRRRRRRGITVVGTVAAAMVAWVIAVPVAGTALGVATASGAGQVSGLDVAVAATAAAVAAWLLMAALERWTSHAQLVWTVSACAALALSLLGPLRAQTDQAAAALMAFHMLVALILIWGFGGPARQVP
jgi:hypothetical protein